MADLDLPDTGPQSEGPHPPRRGSRNRRRRRRGIAAVVAAFLVVLAAIGYGVDRAVADLFAGPADYAGHGHGHVIVRVQPGDTADDIAGTLAHAGVVKSAGAFTRAAVANPKSRSVTPGYYRLHEHMAAAAALRLLLDPGSVAAKRIPVPEGFTAAQILRRTARRTPISPQALRRAAKKPSGLGVPSWDTGGSVEGFLYPATYSFPPHTSATAALSRMVARFGEEAGALDFAGAARKLGYSPYAVLTVASMVQAEGKRAQDFGKIARVFYNRLAKGMPLQSDATLRYVLGLDHGPLTASDLRSHSPYNTRHRTGLPPTPIDSPGEQALKAALRPTPGPWLYFVTVDKAGRTAFASTYAEHQRNVAKAKRNGVGGLG
jgi:UPF0755 protein